MMAEEIKKDINNEEKENAAANEEVKPSAETADTAETADEHEAAEEKDEKLDKKDKNMKTACR